MPPRAPDQTELTADDFTYLNSCLVNYRSTPAPEKEGFRDNCVKYIMRQRSLGQEAYAYKLLSLKVKNWFQNRARNVKTVPLPLRVNQAISPIRAFAYKNEALIRQAVMKRKQAADDEELLHLTTWNNATRQLWAELASTDRDVYDRLAAKWAVDGPEDAIKPILAEKRSPAWMRSVAALFWTQCNMPIFIYGMYKDKDGNMHAAVYDTSNLWRETDKSTPLLRNVPGWDQDFRRVAWNFFSATLRPDLAAPETLQIMKASKRNPPAPVNFARHDDQCPILFDQEDGNAVINSRRQEIFREFIKTHYNLAAGREMRGPPWGSMRDTPEKFFEDGMLPAGFKFNDPSHISEGILMPFFEHVINMEDPASSKVPTRRFRFYQYEMGSGEHRTYHPVVYNGEVEAVQPRRAKKTVSIPVFEEPPSPAAASEPLIDIAPAVPLPLSPINAALESDFESVRQAVQAELAAGTWRGTGSGTNGAAATPGTENAVRVSRRTVAPSPASSQAGNPWIEAEIDAGLREVDEESDLTEEEYDPQRDEDDGDDDDEVEGFLNDISTAEITSLGRAGLPVGVAPHVDDDLPIATGSVTRIPPSPIHERGLVPPAATPTNAYLAPADVPGDVNARLAFLRGLSTSPQFAELLQRVDEGLQSLTTIRAQNPVFWGTWGHKSTHVPEAVHTNEKKAAQLVKWIMKPRDMPASAADIQRFCLVVGMVLRDLDLADSTDGTHIWPDNVPGFMARSSLESNTRSDILTACAAAFEMAPDDAVGVTARAKGKGKAKASKTLVRAAGTGMSLSAADNAPPGAEPVRRSTRTTARRT